MSRWPDDVGMDGNYALKWITKFVYLEVISDIWDDKQKFISHSSRGWEIQNQDVSGFCVWWGSASWFVLCLYMAEWARALSETSYKSTNPIFDGSTLWT